MNEEKKGKEIIADKIYYVQRVVALLMAILIFFPGMNPGRICELINKNVSLFTAGISYGTLTGEMGRALTKGWISQDTMILVFCASLIMLVGIVAAGAGGCLSLGNLKMKKLGNPFSIAGGALGMAGLVMIWIAHAQIVLTEKPTKVGPMFPNGWYVFLVLIVLLLVSSIAIQFLLPKPEAGSKYEM